MREKKRENKTEKSKMPNEKEGRERKMEEPRREEKCSAGGGEKKKKWSPFLPFSFSLIKLN